MHSRSPSTGVRSTADHYDEYLRVAETIAIDCLFNFCRCVIEVFGERYLRRPTAADIQRLLEMHEQRHDFPGMLGSLDCMHWEWKNCPVAWNGQFTRDDYGVPTIMLEPVASADLWICHAFFRVAGSSNDINVLNQSPLFNDVLQGNAPEINFMDPKRKKFKEMQEAARKDVERAFGVFQSRWAIIRGPVRFWYKDKLKDIMYACIILHNMIVEDEGNAVVNWLDELNNDPSAQITQGSPQEFRAYLRRSSELRDREIHHQLRANLVEHIWARYGND